MVAVQNRTHFRGFQTKNQFKRVPPMSPIIESFLLAAARSSPHLKISHECHTSGVQSRPPLGGRALGVLVVYGQGPGSFLYRGTQLFFMSHECVSHRTHPSCVMTHMSHQRGVSVVALELRYLVM